MTTTLRLRLGDSLSDVHVARGALSRLGVLMRRAGIAPGPCVIVSDTKVARLYGARARVALTRAGERLVIAGLDTSTKGGLPENCWHVRVRRALERLGAEPRQAEIWGESLEYRGLVPASPVRPRAAPQPVPPPALPAWAHAPAPVEARPPRPLAPSAMFDDSLAPPPPSQNRRRPSLRFHPAARRRRTVAASA